MLHVLYAGNPAQWSDYQPHLTCALDGLGQPYALAPDLAPELVDYIIFAPSGPIKDLSPFVRAKAVLSLWAGVETILAIPSLAHPLCRMVDDGLTEGMVEWVTGHVLRHHLGLDRHIHGQDGLWRTDPPPPLARERKIAILGLGVLGRACAVQLASLRFDVHGWSRSAQTLDGVTCHAGQQGLRPALEGADMVVLLLPDTPATDNTLDAQSLAWLAPGAIVINPGRGPLIDDDALLDALSKGQVGHATLDVFRQEPLPPDHPYWHHPNVTVTPHIASETRAATASKAIVENIRRGEAGEPFLHLVDRTAGY